MPHSCKSISIYVCACVCVCVWLHRRSTLIRAHTHTGAAFMMMPPLSHKHTFSVHSSRVLLLSQTNTCTFLPHTCRWHKRYYIRRKVYCSPLNGASNFLSERIRVAQRLHHRADHCTVCVWRRSSSRKREGREGIYRARVVVVGGCVCGQCRH